MEYSPIYKKQAILPSLLLFVSVCSSVHAIDLIELNDRELSNVNGQALMSLSYLSPTDTNNNNTGKNLGFYKLGMEAEIELNMNIKKLQLGCGGVNGANGCDIDIDNLSLSGMSDTNTGRASSSAVLTNPFIEFAIRNPNAASTREVVGLRLSAEKLVGLLTTGIANSDTPNGINSLSGYLKAQSGIGSTVAEQSKLKGYGNTSSQYLDLAKYPISGNLVALGLANASFKTNGGGFNIPEMNKLPFETAGQAVVVGNRKTSMGVTASLNIPTIYLGNGATYPINGRTTSNAEGSTTGVYTAGSPVNAVITGCTNTVFFIPACILASNGKEFKSIKMEGTVSGAKATVNFEEALGFIHSLQINSSASLSLQQIAMRWPGADVLNVAQPGWWLALQDPVNLGRIEPTNKLSIEPLLKQFADKAGEYLQKNPAETSDIAAIFSGNDLDANIGSIDLSNVAPLQMNLSNLQLKNQTFAPNCYGSLKFC